ncbi:MAG: prepilin peptidase [Acidiphilium sp.]|nr:prepilin peptidase [Acidiphilium sp.]MDD4934779.1 prepilin peptidase [Acidiphilium sp.]
MIEAWAAIIGLCLLYAALCDLSVRLIPNYLSVAVAALAVPFRVIDHDLPRGLLVAALIFVVLTGVWALRLLGGGDVKLWTACSLLMPPRFASQGAFSVRVILIGGVVAVVYLALRLLVRRRPHRIDRPTERDRSWVRRVWRTEQWRARRGGSIPYGVAIALSALFTFWPPGHG